MRDGAITSYEDLEVFQRFMRLLRPVHDLVLRFPDYEKFALADQMRRASRSVPTNIAEGYSKKAYAKNFKSFLAIAMGSASEMVVHFKIARELGYISQYECDHFVGEYEIIGKQLNRLIFSWRTFERRAPTSNVQPPRDQT